MERTNKNLEWELHELNDVALSWQSHEKEWTMPLANYSSILSRIGYLYNRERKAVFEMLKAAKELLLTNKENAERNAPLTTEDYAKKDNLRYALAEKLYVYSRIMGETDFSHAVDNFTYRGGELMFKHTDEAYNGKVLTMNLKQLLEYINGDRNPEWQDYDAEDWKEGMKEWTDLQILEW